METAAALLADAGNPPLAPHLAANIRAAIGSFRPACVLDQLKARLLHTLARRMRAPVLSCTNMPPHDHTCSVLWTFSVLRHYCCLARLRYLVQILVAGMIAAGPSLALLPPHSERLAVPKVSREGTAARRVSAVCSAPAQLSLAPQYAPVRKQALASLRGLLAEPPADGATPVDAAYARTALQRLTAQEAALLLDWRAAASGGAPWCA